MTAGQLVTTGLVLSRVDFSEADRILTWLTPDHGKVTLIAKAVKRERSRLAGGIELFSESNISFVRGRGDIGTLTSARLIKHYDLIVKDLSRTQIGFRILKIVHKSTEERTGVEWYELTKQTLESLNSLELPSELTELWFNLHWLKLSGHAPNLQTDTQKQPLQASHNFWFDLDKMAFYNKTGGTYNAGHLKFLRLAIRAAKPNVLGKINNRETVLDDCLKLTEVMLPRFVRLET